MIASSESYQNDELNQVLIKIKTILSVEQKSYKHGLKYRTPVQQYRKPIIGGATPTLPDTPTANRVFLFGILG